MWWRNWYIFRTNFSLSTNHFSPSNWTWKSVLTLVLQLFIRMSSRSKLYPCRRSWAQKHEVLRWDCNYLEQSSWCHNQLCLGPNVKINYRMNNIWGSAKQRRRLVRTRHRKGKTPGFLRRRDNMKWKEGLFYLWELHGFHGFWWCEVLGFMRALINDGSRWPWI